jgi:hypothetical protein
MDGVPIDQLRCPTCGAVYELPLRVHTEEEDPEDVVVIQPIVSIKGGYGRVFVECPARHRWTVVRVSRSPEDLADWVQLGQYIGGGQLSA